MGCHVSRLLSFITGQSTSSRCLDTTAKSTEGNRPKYSWESREKLDPKDYTIEGLTDSASGRLPGTIVGQQFIIQNCQNSTVVLFDHIGTISIDDCNGCKIIVGPVKSSIFLRDCKNCVCIIACGQFRMRDCRSVSISLFCNTQPIIESSSQIEFGCYQFFYPQLAEQFRSAGLSLFNNNWWNVHDFTPSDAGSNWDVLVSDKAPLFSFVEERRELGEDFESLEVSTALESSVVPLTVGDHGMHFGDAGFVCVFGNEGSQEIASVLVKDLAASHDGCILVKTKEAELTAADVERIFGHLKLPAIRQKVLVIGLQFSGLNIVENLQNAHEKVAKNSTDVFIYIAGDPQTAAKQADSFFCYADMMMSV